MNRRARLKWLCTDEGRRVAAATARRRRGGLDHRFVLGGLRLVEGGRIELHAVEMGPAWNIVRPVQLTADAARFYCWRTRQAATQFMLRWELADVHVFDLQWADVLPARCSPGNGASAAETSRLSADKLEPAVEFDDVPGQIPMFSPP
jgi:hypothetical protein